MKKYKEWITKYEIMDDYDMESFIKMRILIAHTGINHNGSKFTLESFENAKATLMNKPLLARVVQVGENEYDFNGHDMDWEIDEDGNFKVTYLEQPIGVIPETHDYEIVEYDGREYVAATGYVWRDYTNLAEQIIDKRGQVEVSMEIDFKDDDYHYDEEDGCYSINSFRYRGVTLLGAHVAPGMEKAHATAVYTRKSDDEVTTEYTRMLDKLKEELETMSKKDETETPEVNAYEAMFKSLFNVESLEEFNADEFKIIKIEEFTAIENDKAALNSQIEQFKQDVTSLNSQIEELNEYKSKREKQDADAKRQAIIDEYTALLGKIDTDKIASQIEDLEKLEFALALAFKDKAKYSAPKKTGVKIKSENLFGRSDDNKPKRKLAL